MMLKSTIGFVLIILFTLSPQVWAYTVSVESNRADGNSLLQFELSRDGHLESKGAIPTHGKGVVDPSFAVGPFDSDQEIIVDSYRKLLFAVNSGSNSISVFNILSGGGLQAVQGSPFPSQGVQPVSLGLKDDILTVVNKHQDPAQSTDSSLPNYATFYVTHEGQLTPTGSMFEVGREASPSQALVSKLSTESFLFGADFLDGVLRTFKMGTMGKLDPISRLKLPKSEFSDPKTPRLPLGLALNPGRNLVYVGFPTANKIGVYSYDLRGVLDFENAVPDSGKLVCWLVTNSFGTRLYASNTADASVTVYDIEKNPEAPQEIQKVSLPTQGGAFQLALSPDQSQLLVVTQRMTASTPEGSGNEIHVLNVDYGTGKLQVAPHSPMVLNLPGATRPQGIAIY